MLYIPFFELYAIAMSSLSTADREVSFGSVDLEVF